MERIIVELNVAGTESCYDFELPAQSRIKDIVKDLIAILERTAQNVAYDHDNPMLCDMDRGCKLDDEAILANVGVRDGSKLMLL